MNLESLIEVSIYIFLPLITVFLGVLINVACRPSNDWKPFRNVRSDMAVGPGLTLTALVFILGAIGIHWGQERFITNSEIIKLDTQFILGRELLNTKLLLLSKLYILLSDSWILLFGMLLFLFINVYSIKLWGWKNSQWNPELRTSAIILPIICGAIAIVIAGWRIGIG